MLLQLTAFPLLEEHIKTGRWRRALRDVQALARRFGEAPVQTLWRYGVKPNAPQPMLNVWHKLRGTKPAAPPETLVHPGFLSREALKARQQKQMDHFTSVDHTEREAHYRALTFKGNATVVEETDLRASAHGVEARHPFLDIRLLQFTLSLPARQKFRNGWMRAILRYGMEGILPDAVRWRTTKGDLSYNFGRNLQRM